MKLFNLLSILLLSSIYSSYGQNTPEEYFDLLSGSIPDASNSNSSNDRGGYAWAEASRVESFVYMYRATGNRSYLNEALRRVDNILLNRDDRRVVTSYINNQGVPVTIPVWRSLTYSIYNTSSGCYAWNTDEYCLAPDLEPACSMSGSIMCTPNEGQYPEDNFAYPVLVHSARIMMYMLEVVISIDAYGIHSEQISEDPAGTTYGEKRDELLAEVLITYNEFKALWRENGSEGYYVMRPDISPSLIPHIGTVNTGSDKILPLNMINTMGTVELMLYQITNDPTYKSHAKKLAQRFKNKLFDLNGSYVWTYLGDPYTGDLNDPYGKAEDQSHAFRSVAFAYYAFRNNLVFTEEDMNKFAKTVTQNIIGDPITTGKETIYHFAYRIDGKGMAYPGDTNNKYVVLYDWSILAKFDKTIYEKYLDALSYQYQNDDAPYYGAAILAYLKNSDAYFHYSHIVSGDFDDDPNEEVVIVRQDWDYNHVRITMYDQVHGGLGQAKDLYNGYAINDYVNSIVAGDFNGDGKDELVIAFSSYNDTSPYTDQVSLYLIKDPANHNCNCNGQSSSESDRGMPLYNNSNSYFHISKLTSGNFDSDARDELVIVQQDWDYDHARITLYDQVYNGLDGAKDLYNAYPINEFVNDITKGNFDGIGHDELLISFSTYNDQAPYTDSVSLYMIKAPFSHSCGCSGGATSSNGNRGTVIYQAANSYYHMNKLTSGDFDNSGDDELIMVRQDWDHDQTRITLFDQVHGGLNNSRDLYNAYPLTDRVDAASSGDYNGDGYDEYMISFSSTNDPVPYTNDVGLYLIQDPFTHSCNCSGQASSRGFNRGVFMLGTNDYYLDRNLKLPGNEGYSGGRLGQAVFDTQADTLEDSVEFLVYPNPVNSSFNLVYTLKEDSHVRIAVYDLQGQRLMTLISEFQVQGKYSDSHDASQLRVNLGYILKYQINGKTNYKMLAIK